MATLAILLSSLSAVAQETGYQPRTGDAWIDRQLADVNLYAARYPLAFVDELQRYYAVPRDYASTLVQQPGWTPGDVLMACALGKAIAQPCRAVVREWSRDHQQGWQGVAQRLQDKADPGTAKKIKESIEASYARWARPLALP